MEWESVPMWSCDKQDKNSPAPTATLSTGVEVIEKVWMDDVWSRKVHQVHSVYILQGLVEGCGSVKGMLMHVNLTFPFPSLLNYLPLTTTCKD